MGGEGEDVSVFWGLGVWVLGGEGGGGGLGRGTLVVGNRLIVWSLCPSRGRGGLGRWLEMLLLIFRLERMR